MNDPIRLSERYTEAADVVLYPGDCLDLFDQLPPKSAQLIVTSPPYNIGKKYEKKRALDDYLADQAKVIGRCVELLTDDGSICWEVGNHVAGPQEIVPLDISLYPIFASHGLKLRNRIVWHFEHGLHCSKRFSGRYETILWFTKSDNYIFNLDPVRVPQKYPAKKYFRGPRTGQYSSNPLGKNPGDLWIIPNVKHNHIEKTIHPCQFPVELVERLVLALTNEGGLVIDPYMGVGSTAVAAFLHGRRAAGAEIVEEYIQIARARVLLAAKGQLKTRPMTRPVYVPPPLNGHSEGLQPFLTDSISASGVGAYTFGMNARGERMDRVIDSLASWERPYGDIRERLERVFGEQHKLAEVLSILNFLSDPLLDIVEEGPKGYRLKLPPSLAKRRIKAMLSALKDEARIAG